MQKTAYEMLISDWSSDVCSSDLLARSVYQVWGLSRELRILHHEHRSGSKSSSRLRGQSRGVSQYGRARGRFNLCLPGKSLVGRYRTLFAVRCAHRAYPPGHVRSEEQPSELQSLMRNSSAVFCLQN